MSNNEEALSLAANSGKVVFHCIATQPNGDQSSVTMLLDEKEFMLIGKVPRIAAHKGKSAIEITELIVNRDKAVSSFHERMVKPFIDNLLLQLCEKY